LKNYKEFDYKFFKQINLSDNFTKPKQLKPKQSIKLKQQ